MTTARLITVTGATLAFAAPAFAGGNATITGASRTLDVLSQDYQDDPDEGDTLFGEYTDANSTGALSGPFSDSFAGSSGNASAEADHTSDLFTTANGFVLQNEARLEGAISDTPQFARALMEASSTTTIDFNLAQSSPFSLAGTVFGESALIGGFGSTLSNSFHILLTGPGGTVIDETYDIFDLRRRATPSSSTAAPSPSTSTARSTRAATSSPSRSTSPAASATAAPSAATSPNSGTTSTSSSPPLRAPSRS